MFLSDSADLEICSDESSGEFLIISNSDFKSIKRSIYLLFIRLNVSPSIPPLKNLSSLEFNAQRYYISLRKERNFAFLKIQKKKIGIVVMLDEEKIREKINKYEVSSLSEGVQNFYNGPCARVEITKDKHLDEVINLLVDIQK